MRSGIDPKVDYAFKKLFGTEANSDLLVDLLNAVLQFEPGREIVEVEILNPFNEKNFAEDKLSVVDVKAREASGRQFVVEMQMLARADHRQRVLYYAARLYASQLVEGDEYGELQPAYLISFVNSRVITGSTAFHTRFVLRDATHNLTFTDDFAVHMIELPKFLTVVGDLSGRFDAWCYFLRHAGSIDSASLPKPLAYPPIRKAMEVLNVISEVERERELYESRWKKQLDDRSTAAEYERRDRAQAERQRENEARARENEARARENEAGARENEARARDIAEKDRLAAEKDRLAAEKDRLAAEKDRLAAEKERLAEVKLRVAEEKERAIERREHELLVDKILIAQQKLKLPTVARAELVSRSIADLNTLFAQIEAKGTQGAP